MASMKLMINKTLDVQLITRIIFYISKMGELDFDIILPLIGKLEHLGDGKGEHKYKNVIMDLVFWMKFLRTTYEL